ncbi:MAG: PfkB family carbohydrate kinase [Anaerolineae bacterium]
MAPIQFLVIGHVCRDVVPGGYALGGVVTYAGITASRLGRRAGVLTRCGPDIALAILPSELEWHLLPSRCTTTFHNRYAAGRREQELLALADPIRAGDVPAEWRDVPLVLLGPVAQEVAPEMATLFPTACRGAVLQGWMRQWDAAGRVSNVPALLRQHAFDGFQMVTLSEEELQGDEETLAHLCRRVPVVVLTRGAAGAQVYADGHMYDVPGRPAREVDPTGAGDVFAAAFLIRWHEEGDLLEAARFANVVASFSVEQPGPAGIPDRRQALEWIQQTRFSGEVHSYARQSTSAPCP